MKTIKNIAIIVLTTIFITSCSSNEDPVPVNEEEVITTVIATLTPNGGGTTVTLQSVDLDGDGPNTPTITVSGNLAANTDYTGVMKVLNETVNPAEDITLEILEEDEEHQFFFAFTNNVATAAYNDADSNGNPIGVQFTLATTAAGSGNLTVTLRHEPIKAANGVSTGDITNAGGETDLQVTFGITVE